MSDPRIEIPAVCEVHGGSGRLVIRWERDRVVLDGRADHCCVLTLEGQAVTVLFDMLTGRPLTPGEALMTLFLANADHGRNAANDELVAALRQRSREIRARADLPDSGSAREEEC